MLIRGGTLHTMTAHGTLTGDILVQDGKISAVGKCIAAPADCCVLDAKGLTILPGMIDAQIQAGAETDSGLLQSAQAQGVTAGMIWPENEGACQVITAECMKSNDICVVNPARYTDAQLHDKFLEHAETGLRIACKITDVQTCRRVLQTVHSTRVKAILANLTGCEDMLEAVAMSGCPAIIGVTGGRAGSPWAVAAKLDALGVAVSLTCSYPHAKLRHLPLCAALCVREGLDRQRAMKMITTAPATLLGFPGAGCIEAGVRADFVIYDGDPMLLATSHVMTITGGKIRH